MATDDVFISRAFLRYWRASAVSGLGTYVTLFALQALVVLTLHGSAADVGWLNAARWLPSLVFGLFVGAIVDGWRRLPLMVSTDLAQAALLLTIPVMWWLGLLSLPALTVVVFAYGTAAVVNGAASMSFLPRLLEAKHLQPAHARIDGADAVASTTGPRLAGSWSARPVPRWPSSSTLSATCTRRSRCAGSALMNRHPARASPHGDS